MGEIIPKHEENVGYAMVLAFLLTSIFSLMCLHLALPSDIAFDALFRFLRPTELGNCTGVEATATILEMET